MNVLHHHDGVVGDEADRRRDASESRELIVCPKTESPRSTIATVRGWSPPRSPSGASRGGRSRDEHGEAHADQIASARRARSRNKSRLVVEIRPRTSFGTSPGCFGRAHRSRAISTVLAVGCWTMLSTAGRPAAVVRTGEKASPAATVPRSPRRAGTPPATGTETAASSAIRGRGRREVQLVVDSISRPIRPRCSSGSRQRRPRARWPSSAAGSRRTWNSRLGLPGTWTCATPGMRINSGFSRTRQARRARPRPRVGTRA